MNKPMTKQEWLSYIEKTWDTAQREAWGETPSKGADMSDCPQCEYHKNRAARWRAEAYRQAGHDVIELPWVGLTDEEIGYIIDDYSNVKSAIRAAELQLKEKNT